MCVCHAKCMLAKHTHTHTLSLSLSPWRTPAAFLCVPATCPCTLALSWKFLYCHFLQWSGSVCLCLCAGDFVGTLSVGGRGRKKKRRASLISVLSTLEGAWSTTHTMTEGWMYVRQDSGPRLLRLLRHRGYKVQAYVQKEVKCPAPFEFLHFMLILIA